MAQKRYYTKEGLDSQRKKIRSLESELRDREKQAEEMARQTSNVWHDNAPYESIIQEINTLSKRVLEARAELDSAEIIEYPSSVREDTVSLGTGVRFTRDNEAQEFKIVGYGEQDIGEGRILYESPLARALIGREEGEEFSAEVGGRKSEFRILGVYALGASNQGDKKYL